jgi:hypothetical protein
MNFEFFSNLVKLFGKKLYYACAVFLIIIQFNKTFEELFLIKKEFYFFLWIIAIIAFLDILIICYLKLKEFKFKKEHEKQKTKNFLNSIELVKLNHKNGIKILYFLFNLPVHGDENCKSIKNIDYSFSKEFQLIEIVSKFANILIDKDNKFLLKNKNQIIIFDKEFYEFLKDYFQKNPQKKLNISTII